MTKRPAGASTRAASRSPAGWSGQADREPQPRVVGRQGRGVDHRGRGIQARQLGGLGILPGQVAEQVAGAAADVEHPPGFGAGRQGERRGLVGDLVVQAAEPALLVPGGPLLERSDIAMRRHDSSLPARIARPRKTVRRPARLLTQWAA